MRHPTYQLPRIVLLGTWVNSPCATLIDVCMKNRAVLVELLDVLERAEDDLGHLVGVRDGEPVGGALDLHNLACLSVAAGSCMVK